MSASQTDKSAKIWTGDGNTIFLSNPVSPVKIEPAIYELSSSMVRGLFLQKVRKKFDLPPKIYNMDTEFIKRVIKSFHATNRNMGVLLTGIKGAGKTITGKIIANELNLPVILITERMNGIPEFINNIDFECVIFIDEYEKVFSEDERGHLLTCMDGVQTSIAKALYVLTTNSMYVNDNLLNRPSRVRYVRKYKDIEKAFVTEIVNDLLKNKDHVESTIDVISRLHSITVDLVVEIVREANLHNEPANKFMSIFNCNQSSYEQLYSYKIVDKNTNRVYYDNIMLKASLSPDINKNTWILDKSHNYFCIIYEQTGENSLKMKLKNPDYLTWRATGNLDEDDHDNDFSDEEEETKATTSASAKPAVFTPPPEYIIVDVVCEQIQKKHWMYAMD